MFMIYRLKWVWGLRTIGIARRDKHVGPQALSPLQILSILLTPYRSTQPSLRMPFSVCPDLLAKP